MKLHAAQPIGVIQSGCAAAGQISDPRQKQIQVVLYGADSRDSEIFNQNPGYIGAEECRERRTEVDIFDSQG